MTRGTFGVQATLEISKKTAYELGLLLSVGDGPTELRIGPGEKQEDRLAIKDMVVGLAGMLGISRIGEVGGLPTSWPWSKILAIEVQPELTVEVTDKPSVALTLELYEKGKHGVHLPGEGVPSWLTIKPNFTVYDLVIGYDKKRGLDVRARIEIEDQKTTLRAGPSPPAKQELVSFPFPTPPPANQNLQVKYLGLGQRFGPEADLRSEDPLKKLFEELEEKLSSNNPTELLESLAGYYDANRDWFFGAHVLLRGWEVRAVLSDPALYGLEVTCSVEPYKGLKVEILYQKLGSGVGVFYGELEMPEKFRTIQLGVVSLTIPSFKLWIYTNGDFKVSVGWPLGPNSIGVQVYVFTGGGGFYFAKLRSADNPASGGQALLAQGSMAVANATNYNPILEFGLGIWFGVGRSFSAGPFSAELSLTMRGTFQGLLAWKAPPPEGGPEKASSIAKAPDYYWFAASVGIVGVLQGKVDLKIVSLSVLVRIEASAAIALETGCATKVIVRASVEAEASLRIVFITITVGFHTTIEQSFTLSGGRPEASIDGPQERLFLGMNDWAVAGLEALEATLLENARLADAAALPAAPPAPVSRAKEGERTTVEVGFLLQPAAVYNGKEGTTWGFAGLVVSTEAPAQKEGAPPKSQFEKLTDALAEWLLKKFGGTKREWSAVAEKLEALDQLEWDELLEGFVADELKLEIHGISLEEAKGKLAFLPMLEDLQMSWTGREKPVIFADKARTRPHYEEVVEKYFAELSLAGLGPKPPGLDPAMGGDGEEEPPSGPSLTRFIFGDYFLMISRQLAKELAGEEKQSGAGALPSAEQAMHAAGLGSRYLLSGLRLPDPATTPEHISPDEFPNLTIASGYALNGQQFELDASKPKCEATLRVRSEPSSAGKAIAFAGGGESATASMPVEKAPPAPAPVWVGPDKARLEAGSATITLSAIPPGTPENIWIGVRNRLPWQGTEEEPVPSIVPLPPEVATEAGEGDLRLVVRKEPPSEEAEEEQLASRPALLIPVRAHRVDRLRLQDLKSPSGSKLTGDQTPEVESPYVPFVYRLDGTDDATRAQISAALAANALGGTAKLTVLYNDEKAGYRSDQVDPAQVLLAKANLSTTSQPTNLAAPLRLAMAGELGPAAANLGQVSNFAWLLWELSVVQAGGFYLRYKTRDEKGLPDRIFDSAGELPEKEEPTGDTAELTLAITFPEETPVSRWHNAFVVPLGEFQKALYVGLTDTAKKPLQTLHPSYPPGCVGFDGVWEDAHLLEADAGGELYEADWVAQLYHQLQFKVSGGEAGTGQSFDPSLWSLALSPVKNKAGEKGPTDRYRQVLPAYRFAHEAGTEPNPYGAVGGKVQLTFRIGDVFGNVLESATHDGSFPLLYNDPLLGPGEWPGVRIAHRFLPATTGQNEGAQLRLSFAFDPEAVVKVGTGQEDRHAAEEQAKAALGRYATALAQLQDARTKAVVTTSLPGLLGDPGPINAELAQYARDIVKQLEKAAEGKKAEAVSCDLKWPIDPTRLSQAESDIVRVEVALEMSRPKDLVYVGSNGKPVEKGVRSSFPVAADLSPRKKQGAAAGDPTPPEVALLPYAEDFEETFADWDGKGGAARLAARHDREDLAANAPTPPLWVLRMTTDNPAAGIDVKFEESKAAYFSLAPLALELVNDKAQVPEYDENLKERGKREEAFTGIDLDQWGEAFLAAVDEVLSPAIGTALALANGKAYEELMVAKADLAAALAKGVEPVFDGTNEEVVEGDVESAREAFEQSVLAKLASAFTVSTIVQVPAAVSAHDAAGPKAPRLFGAVSAVEDASQNSAEESVALSSPKLRLENGRSQPFLTFMASATDPGKAAILDLSLSWNARFVEHLIDRESKKYGYEPSEWLRFVREYEDDPLNYLLGKFHVPVPSRRFPSTPVLEGQSATQVTSKGKELAEFLSWKYESGVLLGELEAQDNLRLAVTYNRPLESPPKATTALDEEEPTLFEALAAFTVAWQVLRPPLQGLPDDSSSEAAERAATIFVQQAQRVAGAWARHYETLRAEAFTAPSERIDHYAFDFKNKAKNEIQVYAQVPSTSSGEGDEKAIVWPLVNGKEAGPPEPATDPPDSGRWYVATYEFKTPPSGDAAKLELEWAPLDVLALQTGCSAGWLTRNADLSGGSKLPTNSAFVYKTPEVGFNNPVVPLIIAPEVSSPSEGSLATTLEKALAPLARAGTGIAKQRLLKLWCDYEFTLVGEGGEAIRSKTPILLADEIELLPEKATGKNGSKLEEICKELEENCGTWFEYFRPSREEAKLLLAVVLIADLEGAKLPLVRVEALRLDVLPSWWP